MPAVPTAISSAGLRHGQKTTLVVACADGVVYEKDLEGAEVGHNTSGAASPPPARSPGASLSGPLLADATFNLYHVCLGNRARPPRPDGQYPFVSW